MRMKKLEVNHISKSFDAKPILQDISISLNQGELVSLLGVSGYGEEEISVPVGYEETLQMYPMDFEEFLWATGDTSTSKLLRTVFEKKISLGEAVHRKLMRDFPKQKSD